MNLSNRPYHTKVFCVFCILMRKKRRKKCCSLSLLISAIPIFECIKYHQIGNLFEYQHITKMRHNKRLNNSINSIRYVNKYESFEYNKNLIVCLGKKTTKCQIYVKLMWAQHVSNSTIGQFIKTSKKYNRNLKIINFNVQVLFNAKHLDDIIIAIQKNIF